MSLLGSEALTHKVKQADTIVDYESVRTYASGVTIYGTVVSVPGKVLEMLELSERQSDPRYLISEDEVSNGELIVIDGNDYKVIRVYYDERHTFLQHYESVIIKVKE